MQTRIRTKWCTLFLISIVLIAFWISYQNTREGEAEDIVFQENSPFQGPPIFFLNTVENSLSLRTACAVESASFRHPQSQITFYSTYKIHNSSITQTLGRIANVKFQHITVEEALANTALYEWYVKYEYNRSKFISIHTRNAVKLSLLTKNGGIYLDNDVWCLRELNGQNSMELANENYLDDSVLIFDKWHRFLILSIMEFAGNYVKYSTKLNFLGDLFGEVIRKRCDVRNDEMLASVSAEKFWNCLYIRILPVNTLNSIHDGNWEILFDVMSFEMLDNIYTVHIKDVLSKNTHANPGSGVAIDYMARFNCPLIYQEMVKVNRI